VQQRIEDTDFFILREFREKAAPLKAQTNELTMELKRAAISGFVAPFLKRLENNGWDQRTRMVTLLEIWSEL
jgi:hypothetical protein